VEAARKTAAALRSLTQEEREQVLAAALELAGEVPERKN
jgi:hypothetical protein